MANDQNGQPAPRRRRSPSDLMGGMDVAPPTGPTASTPASPAAAATPSVPIPSVPIPPAGQDDVTRIYAGTVDHVRTPARPPSMRPARQPARTATIGLRVTQAVLDHYEQWCRDVAARYGVPQKVVTAHVAEHLIEAFPQIEQDIADWVASE